MTNAVYYAIQQKSTGYFLPTRTGSGHTFSEPQSTSKVVPRLFTTKRNATIALTWWLKGWYIPKTASQSETRELNNLASFEPSQHESVLQSNRHPEDFEVVPMLLTRAMNLNGAM